MIPKRQFPCRANLLNERSTYELHSAGGVFQIQNDILGNGIYIFKTDKFQNG